LVGDTDGGHIIRLEVGGLQGLASDRQLGLPDFGCIVFDPTVVGKILSEFLLGDGQNFPSMIEQDGSGAGGALIEC
jgi:hypothetical protein